MIANTSGDTDDDSLPVFQTANCTTDTPSSSVDSCIRRYASPGDDYVIDFSGGGASDTSIVFASNGGQLAPSVDTPASTASLDICRSDGRQGVAQWVKVSGAGSVSSYRDDSHSGAHCS